MAIAGAITPAGYTPFARRTASSDQEGFSPLSSDPEENCITFSEGRHMRSRPK